MPSPWVRVSAGLVHSTRPEGGHPRGPRVDDTGRAPHGILDAMKAAIQTTIDSAGRLVLPKAVRDEAGIQPGMTLRLSVQEGRIEIEPAPREIRIVQKGPLWVAVSAEEGPVLEE